MGCCGTWIDWQYLLGAAALLAKCRYTLQYTYPYAYYMEPSPRKELVWNLPLGVFFKVTRASCAETHGSFDFIILFRLATAALLPMVIIDSCCN
jgi:hypothetical protein